MVDIILYSTNYKKNLNKSFPIKAIIYNLGYSCTYFSCCLQLFLISSVGLKVSCEANKVKNGQKFMFSN